MKRSVIALIALVLSVTVLPPRPAGAAEVARSIDAPSGSDLFGFAVAVHGDLMVVGAPGIGNGEKAGVAHVYLRTGEAYAKVATLLPSDSVAMDGFGRSVAIHDDFIVVGKKIIYAGMADTSAAYVYKRPAAGWAGTLTESSRLTPSAPDAGFAGVVDIESIGEGIARRINIAVIGASDVYVYSRAAAGWLNDYTESAILDAADPRDIAMDGDVVVAGAPGSLQHRTVDVFVKPAAGWAGAIARSAVLTASHLPGGFGSVDVADAGDTIVVGAENEWMGEEMYVGGVYVFTRPAAGWSGTLTPQARLTSALAVRYDGLGADVASDGTRILAVAPATSTSRAPRTFEWVRPAGGWSGELDSSTVLVGGSAVDVDHGRTAVGDHLYSSTGGNSANSGRVWTLLHDQDGDRVSDFTDTCPGTANADQADLDADGDGDVCDADDDGDAIDDVDDTCPTVTNADQLDTDADGVGDACDGDDDHDGVVDATDTCPLISNADQADLDGDGLGDACDDDDDGDGVNDTTDSCPLAANPAQHDLDDDDVGDACDEANQVDIDVMPGDTGNAVRTAGRHVPVAVLTTPTFDAPTRIEVGSLRFGRTGVEASAASCSTADADADGDSDLVCTFEARRTGLGVEDTTATLTGSTLGDEATSFTGSDGVAMGRPSGGRA